MASLMEALAKAACTSARKAKSYTDEKISKVNENFAASAGMVEGLEGYSMRGSKSGSEITIDDMRDLPSKVRVKVLRAEDEEESLVNLVPYPYVSANAGETFSEKGVHFEVKDDGSIEITTDEDGATSFAQFVIIDNSASYAPFELGTYYTRYHYSYADGQITISFRYYRGTDTTTSYIFLPQSENGSSSLLSTAIGIEFYIQVKSGTVLTEPVTVYPMIVKGQNVSITSYVPPQGLSVNPNLDVTITTTSADDTSTIGETITTQIGETVELSPVMPAMKITTNREDVTIKAAYNRKIDTVIEKITDAFIRLGGNV